MNKVIIFTMDGCSHCLSLKNDLYKESIPFREIEITKNRKLWEQVVDQVEQDYVPTVFIQEDDEGNGSVYLPERDFQNNDEVITIIKKYL